MTKIRSSRDRSRKSTAQQNRRGAAAVELAVVLPLFLLLLAGIIEFGQVFKIEHALSSASRRGARSAVVAGATVLNVQKRVKTQCAETIGADEADVTVTVSVNGVVDGDLLNAESGDEVSVTVSVPFADVGTGFYSNTFSNSILSSTCVLEHE